MSPHSPNQQAEQDGESIRAWRLAQRSVRTRARTHCDNAVLEDNTPVMQTKSSHSPAASDRCRAALPSSTTEVDSAAATQKTESHCHRTTRAAHLSTPTPIKASLYQPELNTRPDGSSNSAPVRSMFQQPGMTNRQSNDFVFDPALQNSHQSLSASSTDGLAATSTVYNKIVLPSKAHNLASPSSLETVQPQSETIAQLPPPVQADVEA